MQTSFAVAGRQMCWLPDCREVMFWEGGEILNSTPLGKYQILQLWSGGEWGEPSADSGLLLVNCFMLEYVQDWGYGEVFITENKNKENITKKKKLTNKNQTTPPSQTNKKKPRWLRDSTQLLRHIHSLTLIFECTFDVEAAFLYFFFFLLILFSFLASVLHSWLLLSKACCLWWDAAAHPVSLSFVLRWERLVGKFMQASESFQKIKCQGIYSIIMLDLSFHN